MSRKNNPQNNAPRCCTFNKPIIGEKDFFGKGVSRRDFLFGLGAGAVGAWALSSSSAKAAPLSPGGEMTRIGSPLRVKPVLVYGLSQRREATSWRPWGGLHTQDDVNNEVKRIEAELKKLASETDFPVEMLPVALVRNAAEAAPIRDSDCDTILVYASGGWMDALETLAASKAHNIMFVRHKSGPVYLWYEIAHPHFLRKATDEYKQPRMDVWDVVVDKYSEVLWRLRALFGLKNTLGAKIVAIGDAGGWGIGHQLGPKTARDIWKFDIIPVTYKDLDPMIKSAMADEKAMQKAQKDADEYLSRKGVSLHTPKKFVVNALLLTDIFRDLMAKANAPAITIHHCMGTIIPMSQTTACLPLNLINDEGLIAFCESDFVVIPAGILLRYISGKPSFLNNPCFPYDGLSTNAHCTGPSRMNGKDFEPTEIWTHYESDYGAAPKVNRPKGQVITNLVADFAGKTWLGCRAKIIDSPFYDICRDQMDIEIEGNWKKVLEDMRGFHWMTCYGDYLREVGYALKKLGVGWENATEV